LSRSRLKKVFSPDIGVDASFQVLAILEYASGLNLGLALISNENPNFEMPYRNFGTISAAAGTERKTE